MPTLRNCLCTLLRPGSQSTKIWRGEHLTRTGKRVHRSNVHKEPLRIPVRCCDTIRNTPETCAWPEEESYGSYGDLRCRILVRLRWGNSRYVPQNQIAPALSR